MTRFHHGRSLPASALLILSLGACQPKPAMREVTITGNEYAFTGPDSLAAGDVALTFQNTGRMGHEMVVTALKAGVTLDSAMRATEEERDGLIDPTSGILIADPGITSPGRLLLTLEAGRTYVLACNFQDSDSAPPHIALGMLHPVKVY